MFFHQVRKFRRDVDIGDKVRVTTFGIPYEGYVAAQGFGLSLTDKPVNKPIGFFELGKGYRAGVNRLFYWLVNPEYEVLNRFNLEYK